MPSPPARSEGDGTARQRPPAGRSIGRREALRAIGVRAGALAALSVIPVPAAAALPEIPRWMLDLVRERLGTTDLREGRVELALPSRADTGLSVPLKVSVPDSPMTPEDHVKSVHVLTTRNPQPLVTDYWFTPRSGVARVAQRIRLAQSQYVFGFARMSDDSAWMTAKHVSVSIGACAVEIFLPDAERARRRRR
ncbi:MAG: hypothetical protein OXC01_14675 [Immundisolibacterales bacterium]|nr:hypothetical protein [Immundisolibacterales bacterium]